MAKKPIQLSIEIGRGITVSAETKTFPGTKTVKATTYTITAEGDHGRQAMLVALAAAIRLCTFGEAVELVEMIRG